MCQDLGSPESTVVAPESAVSDRMGRQKWRSRAVAQVESQHLNGLHWHNVHGLAKRAATPVVSHEATRGAHDMLANGTAVYRPSANVAIGGQGGPGAARRQSRATARGVARAAEAGSVGPCTRRALLHFMSDETR